MMGRSFIRLSESDICDVVKGVLEEARGARPSASEEPYVMIDNINGGKYDDKIIFGMSKKRGDGFIFRWLARCSFDDYWKQQVYELIKERYFQLKSRKSDTDIVRKSILDGDFDEEIARGDYAWFNEHPELFGMVIKKSIEQRIKNGKRRGLFYGLPSDIGYKTIANANLNDTYFYLLLGGESL